MNGQTTMYVMPDDTRICVLCVFERAEKAVAEVKCFDQILYCDGCGRKFNGRFWQDRTAIELMKEAIDDPG